MELNWRARLMQEPEWQDVSRWPFVDTQRLGADSRRCYLHRARIVASVLDGRPLNDVAREFQVSAGWVTQLMNRCLAGDEDAPPALSRGLLPQTRLHRSRRQSALGSFAKPAGDRCAFEHLLDTVPGLLDYLMKEIRRAVNRHRRGQNLTPRGFHASLIAYLTTQGWPQDTYPFTSISRGYESARRFLKHALADLQMPRHSGRVTGPRSAPVCAFQEIHIDEAHVDCHGTAAVVLHGRMKPVRLGRISLLLARDVGTGAYLAGTLALTAHPSAADVLALLEQLVTPWAPLTLTAPGLAYAARAGFPSALDETFCRPAFGIVRLDNSLAHLSHQVRRMVCDHLGSTVNFGLAKNPKTRALIEQAFRRLNVDIHRFPSTTGSYPTDPLREPAKLQKEPPFVSLRVLEEAVSVLLVEHNVRPLGNQGAITPLEQMEYQMANHLLPLRATTLGPGLGPYERSQVATVRKGPTAAQPRINFEGCQYTGAALDSAAWVNQKVTIIYDIRDIRTLTAVTLDGRELGVVDVQRTWRRYPHSISLRKRINRLVREHALSKADPLGGFMDYMMAHRHLPREALTLVQLDRQLPPPDGPQPEPPPNHDQERLTEDPRLKKALKRLPDWTPGMAKQRKHSE